MTSANSRPLAVCLFANEKDTTPREVCEVPWLKIVEEHRRRRVRSDKTGVMLGGYKITGDRANDNVLFRSVIQLDIDTEVQKDEQTRRIVAVTRQAPPLDQIRSNIEAFEWVAVSSHSQEPGRGIIKYRIVILPDRDIQRGEWKPLLEALDERLLGALDRGAWPWSQAFYLPSCPAEEEDSAFFEHNEGAPLPVDEFVRVGRDIMMAAKGLGAIKDANAGALGGNILPVASPPPPVETMRGMLRFLAPRNCFEHRSGVIHDAEGRIVKVGWMETGMALKAAYGEEGFDLWAETHIDDRARADAPTQWRSFAAEAQPGHVTIATLTKAARDADFPAVRPSPAALPTQSETDSEQITGFGADVKNGRVFASMFRRKLLHVYETGEWLAFDPEQGWVSPEPGEADRAAKEALTAMRTYAAAQYRDVPDDPKTKRLMAHVERTSKAQNLRAMIEMAKSERGMTVRLSDFDDDSMLLGVANGVLDLRTGTLLPISPDVLVSKRCNVAYDPRATCPRFLQFLKEVQPEKEVATFLLRFMGYCLTGDVSRQVFAFFYGHGANGKSVFIELMAWLLDDYAHKIATDMLMHHQRNPQGPSPDIVSLKGRRFVYANETEEGRRLAEARIKDLTGGDTLTGRVPYGKVEFAFRPTHKLIIVGNHKPEITDMSAGMWRRVLLTPFDQTIPKAQRDPNLLETLKTEGPGILNLLLLGLRDYLHDGLPTPTKIKAATDAYRDEQDILADWISGNCIAGASCSVKKMELYADYAQWVRDNGHMPFSQSRLTRRLNDRGYKLAPDKRTVTGLALKPVAPMARNV